MNIIKSFIVDAECFIRILDELMNGKRSIIRLEKEMFFKRGSIEV